MDDTKLYTAVENKRDQIKHKLLDKDSNLQPLQLDTKEKDLGIWFQNNLKFDEHCNYVVNRSNKLLGLIKRTFKALDKESFLILYKSLTRSSVVKRCFDI